METSTDERTMTLTRHFDATPAQVYAAWTDPDVLPRWFGPNGFSCETHVMDLRVGGEWRFTMHHVSRDFANRHRWTALVPPGDGPGRIEFLMDGLDGDAPKEVAIRIEPEGTGTRLTQVMTFPDVEAVALARTNDAETKGYETLTKLAAALGE